MSLTYMLKWKEVKAKLKINVDLYFANAIVSPVCTRIFYVGSIVRSNAIDSQLNILPLSR